MRRLKRPWVTEYIEWVEPTSDAPESFHFWTAVTILAASLKKHVWIDRISWKLYPNMFTLLVAKPGTGKGEALNPGLDLLRDANTAHILSDRLTMPFVLECLAKGFPSQGVSQTGGVTLGTESAALIYAPELSVFIRNPDEYLPDLASLWDSPDRTVPYGTRGSGELKIKSPCVSLLAGSSPQWMARAIPYGAVSGGFSRRVNFVYAKERIKFTPWPSANGFLKQRSDLIDDLRYIATNVRGELKFDKDAEPVFEKYHSEARMGDFDDEATGLFKTSKWAHACKLASILSASESDALRIRKRTLLEAIDKVDQVIKDIGLVFRAVGESDMSETADRVLQFIELRGFVTQQDIMQALWKHIGPVDNLIAILTMLVQGQVAGERQQGNKIVYFPTPKVNP